MQNKNRTLVRTKFFYIRRYFEISVAEISVAEISIAEISIAEISRVEGTLVFYVTVKIHNTVELQWLENGWLLYHGCFKLVLESLGKQIPYQILQIWNNLE